MGNRFELLRLVQSRLGGSMFGHLGLQAEISRGQSKIGLVQFEAQAERLCEDSTEMPSCQRQRHQEHNAHCATRSVYDRPLRVKAQSHWQACRQDEGEE